jgi:hypothetical protein
VPEYLPRPLPRCSLSLRRGSIPRLRTLFSYPISGGFFDKLTYPPPRSQAIASGGVGLLGPSAPGSLESLLNQSGGGHRTRICVIWICPYLPSFGLLTLLRFLFSSLVAWLFFGWDLVVVGWVILLISTSFNVYLIN